MNQTKEFNLIDSTKSEKETDQTQKNKDTVDKGVENNTQTGKSENKQDTSEKDNSAKDTSTEDKSNEVEMPTLSDSRVTSNFEFDVEDDNKQNQDKDEVRQESGKDKPQDKQEDDSQERQEAQVKKEEYERLKNEYEQLKQQSQSQPQTDFASERIAQLNQLVRDKGEDILNDPNFQFFQRFDSDKYNVSNKDDALELLRHQHRMRYQDLNSDEVEGILRDNYASLFDDDVDTGDEDYQRDLRKLKRDSIEAKNFLAEKGKEYALPDVQVNKPSEEELKKIEDANRAYNEGVESFSNNLNQISFDVKEMTDGAVENLNYRVSDESKKMVESYLKKGRNDEFFNQFVSQDDSGNVQVDANSMAEAIVWGNEKENIIKTLIHQGISIGEERADDRYDKTSLDEPKSQGGDRKEKDTASSMLNSIAQSIRNENKKSIGKI